jgi:3',5'-cyclic AMP phosphodiesterase CpdA
VDLTGSTTDAPARVEVTTVADDLIEIHTEAGVHRFEGLEADTDYTAFGVGIHTLARPAGDLLARFATTNDVHLGEHECGRVGDEPNGPILRSDPGEDPYPTTMNRGAVAEIAALDPAAVLVKGDLTNDGTDEEFALFDQMYRGAFGDRLHVVRGNHDAYRGQHAYEGHRLVPLSGLTVAMLDTAIPHSEQGTISPEDLEWLDAVATDAETPVFVVGHHHQWIGDSEGSGVRGDNYFGLRSEASDALAEMIGRRRSIIAYAAGHTHRHRVRETTDGVPSIEVGCVKDFPGTWAEYRVYEGGVMQVVHRISSPDALAWSDRCRALYSDFGLDYVGYAMGQLSDRCFTIPLR